MDKLIKILSEYKIDITLKILNLGVLTLHNTIKFPSRKYFKIPVNSSEILDKNNYTIQINLDNIPIVFQVYIQQRKQREDYSIDYLIKFSKRPSNTPYTFTLYIDSKDIIL